MRELGAGDLGVNMKIKNMVSSFMGRQKVYCDCFENKNFKKLEVHIIKNVYRNVIKYDNNPKLLTKYCEECIKSFDNKKLKYFISNDFCFPEINIFLN